MNRRTLITGIVSLIAAPAIVQASSLMSIRGDVYRIWQYRCLLLPDIGWRWEKAHNEGVKFDDYAKEWMSPNGNLYEGIWTFFGKSRNIYSDTQIGFRKVEIIPQ